MCRFSRKLGGLVRLFSLFSLVSNMSCLIVHCYSCLYVVQFLLLAIGLLA
jgi:hypothetical protein